MAEHHRFAPNAGSELCPECRLRFLQVTSQSYMKQEAIQRLKSVISMDGSHVGFLQHHISSGATEQDPDLASHFEKCLEDEMLVLVVKHKELLVAEHGSGDSRPFLWPSADGQEALDTLQNAVEQICRGGHIESLRPNGSKTSALNSWRQYEKDLTKVLAENKTAAFEKNVDKVLESVVKQAEKELAAFARMKKH